LTLEIRELESYSSRQLYLNYAGVKIKLENSTLFEILAEFIVLLNWLYRGATGEINYMPGFC